MRPTVLGAGPLTFRCVAPFATWQMNFDGGMTETSTAQLVSGEIDGPTVAVQFEVEASLAVPPWEQGPCRPRRAASSPTLWTGS